MEPMPPALRDELKRAHPGLTDADIDEYEALLSRRFALDPSRSADEIRAIDERRLLLVRTKMPNLAQVQNAFTARAREQARRPRPTPRVDIKRPPLDAEQL